jgi:predicted dehydrogenase
MEAFAKAVRAGEGEPPAVSGEDGLRALRVLLGVYESFKRQAVVAIG